MLERCCKNAFTLFYKRFENFKQFQAFHVVFGRACGATLTTLNAKKIPFSFLNATISSPLARLRCLGPPFGFLSAGIDRPDVPSSCLRLTRGILAAPKAAWRRQLAAQTLKKLPESLQKQPRERLGERSEPQEVPGEP